LYFETFLVPFFVAFLSSEIAISVNIDVPSNCHEL
jgi:hypothetical protein